MANDAEERLKRLRRLAIYIIGSLLAIGITVGAIVPAVVTRPSKDGKSATSSLDMSLNTTTSSTTITTETTLKLSTAAGSVIIDKISQPNSVMSTTIVSSTETIQEYKNQKEPQKETSEPNGEETAEPIGCSNYQG
jgi:hypothetical protein